MEQLELPEERYLGEDDEQPFTPVSDPLRTLPIPSRRSSYFPINKPIMIGPEPIGRIVVNLTPKLLEIGLINRYSGDEHKGKVNQDAFMRLTGINHVTAWKILRHPDTIRSLSFDTIARICHAFHMTPNDFMRYEPAPDGPQAPLSDSTALGQQG